MLCSRKGAKVDLNDHPAVRKRLDALYASVGRAAEKGTVPDALASSHQAALAAAAEVTAAAAKLKEARHARQAAYCPGKGAGAEAIRLEADVSQAKTELQQAQVRSNFAWLVLGRECVGNDFHPGQVDKEVQEIRRLQEHLDRLR